MAKQLIQNTGVPVQESRSVWVIRNGMSLRERSVAGRSWFPKIGGTAHMPVTYSHSI
jgi:hypothetical protein